MQKQHRLKDFLQGIKSTLDAQFSGLYNVTAEIGDLKVNQSGHCYLELVEKAGNKIIAKCRANIWANNFHTIFSEFETQTGEKLREGMSILSKVQVTFHETFGLSLNIVAIDPSYTIGERARRRKEVIEKLKDEGLFELNHNLSLPLVPEKIAIISSPSAAGYGDFMNHIENNPYGYSVKVDLYKAILQGDGAAKSIIEVLKSIFYKIENYQLVIILRGGGSQLDLDCFDSYELNRALARFPLPIITGIGHERDQTISDMIANKSLKTPTAVADFILQKYIEFEESLLSIFNSISKLTTQKISNEILILNNKKLSLSHLCSTIINKETTLLNRTNDKLVNAFKSRLQDLNYNLRVIEGNVKNADPATILKKGYTLTSFNGKVLTNKSGVKNGDEIKTIGIGFELKSIVIEKNETK